MAEYDQLDLPNIAGAEILLRRCQMIEYHHEKRIQANSGQIQGGGLSRSEASYFTGTHRSTGELMMSPELLEYVGREVEKDVAVDKQLRKAREEAKLCRSNRGGAAAAP